eukprot:CAMPEP_0175727210 /NCGR_PEP_ID=MMETSP0097-20121207/48661_1 /TAXON_ID=311494 /ORGANISM="Alexandrium monilatum, Strain CCMP3105" /LENGTH=169 /DNA_ID=CAMNT_0017035015 /DNA_START=47 /DNA_END=551 /DNA_ORIENTATION=+
MTTIPRTGRAPGRAAAAGMRWPGGAPHSHGRALGCRKQHCLCAMLATLALAVAHSRAVRPAAVAPAAFPTAGCARAEALPARPHQTPRSGRHGHEAQDEEGPGAGARRAEGQGGRKGRRSAEDCPGFTGDRAAAALTQDMEHKDRRCLAEGCPLLPLRMVGWCIARGGG